MTHPLSLKSLFILFLVSLSFIVLTSQQSLAADPNQEITCTNSPGFDIPDNLRVITTVVDNITCVLYGTSATVPCAGTTNVAESMFTKISNQISYKLLAQAVASLFIIFFAISFMLGIVQLSIVEFTIRAFKISIILALATGGMWAFFYNTVGVFFQNGTNWLIARSVQIALGTIPGINPNAPFELIDHAINLAFSAKMFVTIMAMLFTGPYGWLFFGLMVLGLGSFVSALFQAIWIYLMSMIVRAFLFGLAPIFFLFLLFNRTRHLFDGWLNQLVNSVLQPVLLFSFFSFFVVLVQASMENILETEACYMPGNSFLQGVPGDTVLPRLKVNGQIYTGRHDFEGPVDIDAGPQDIFPIDLIDVLIFILLTQLAWRFNSVALNIAKEIAGVSTSFNTPGAFSEILSPRHAATRRAMSQYDSYAGSRKEFDRTAAATAQAAAGPGENDSAINLNSSTLQTFGSLASSNRGRPVGGGGGNNTNNTA